MPVFDTSELLPNFKSDSIDQIYCGLDNCITIEVFEELKRIHDPLPQIYNFERALQAPLLEMMLRGFKIDQYERQKAVAQLTEDIVAVHEVLQELSKAVWNRSLNPRSDDQLKALFYGVMQLPEVWTSKKGVRKLSMDRDTLEKLSDYFYARPLVNCILSYRDLDKLRSSLKTEIDPDGRWRTSYSFAETGRLKSSKSAFGVGGNLQNLRQDDNYSDPTALPSVRRIFISDLGWKLCNIDLEQTEACDVGWLQGTLVNDWKYLDAIEQSGDLHVFTSRLVWPELPWAGDLKKDREIADEPFYRMFSYRQMAKRGGFLSSYLGTAWTMARNLRIPIGVAQRFQNAYCLGRDCAFPGFASWWQWVAQELQTKQYLITPFGRRRDFFGRPREDTTLREAIAYSPQSTTADRMNLGMWRIWKHMPEVQLLAQVHDSVCFQFPEHLDEKEIVSHAVKLTRVDQVDKISGRSMFVRAEAKVGWNWGSWDSKLNPDGMKKFSLAEPDSRSRMKERLL